MNEATLKTSLAFFQSDRPSYEQFHKGRKLEYLQNADLSYSEFFRDFLLPNYPCILSPEFTEGWRSRQQWVKGDGRPDFEHLLKNFGNSIVPVANCDVKEYNANPKHNIPLRDYLSYWKEQRESGYSSPQGCLYMKDWHMHRLEQSRAEHYSPLSFVSNKHHFFEAYNNLWFGNAATMSVFCSYLLQLLLKACTGINYCEFYTFLKIIAKNRMAVLEATSGDSAPLSSVFPAELSALGPCHSVFDLHRTEDVLTSILANEDFSRLDTDLYPCPENLLHEIKEVTDAALS
uniref:2-oxoglutarate and iron-dependent oxygenase JMJD4 n=1 Tax=Pristiophorus japonicus TaxID=55135 RepID=UPI00398E3E6E